VLHVFVETNWVVDYAAPAHYRVPAAARLLDRARNGEFRLHLPSISLSEARRPIFAKQQSRHSDTIRQFLKWSRSKGLITPIDDEATRRVLGAMERQVHADLRALDLSLRTLMDDPALDVFPLDSSILEKTLELTLDKLDLHPFDQAVPAAILVRAETLRADGADQFAFCELDSDLQPWDKKGNSKQPLAALYDGAGVWVYGDFVMKTPRRPEGWTGRPA